MSAWQVRRTACRYAVVPLTVLFAAVGCREGDGQVGLDEPTSSPEPTVPAAEVAVPTVAGPDEAEGVEEFDWRTAGLDVGVRDLQVWGSVLVGTAEQNFTAPSDLVSESDDEGCVGFEAGRSGEVVQSSDGLTWKGLGSQPSWYDGPTTVEEWARRTAANESPFDDVDQVALLVQQDQLFAVSHRRDGHRDELAPTAGVVIVEAWDDVNETWEPLSGTDRVIRSSEVSAASGSAGLVVVANGSEGEPLLWTLTGGEMVSAEDPVLDRLLATGAADLGSDAELADLLRSFELFATSDGFVAQFAVGDGEFVMLRSEDGREWTEVTDAPSSELNELAAYEGVVIATAFGEELWRSNDDGRTWDLDTAVPGGAIIDIAAGAGGWALWTADPGGIPDAIYYSPDASRWQEINDLSGQDIDWVTGLAVTSDAIVAITGYTPNGGWVCPDIVTQSYQAHLRPFGS